MQIQMHMSRNLHLEERMEFLEHPAQSSTEQYRCSMRVIYCSETMCLARVKLTSNGQVTGLGPRGVTFAISGFKRAKMGKVKWRRGKE